MNINNDKQFGSIISAFMYVTIMESFCHLLELWCCNTAYIEKL